MADDRGKRRDPKVPQIYEETQQVRIRSKNPLIERKPSERADSDATVASTGPPPLRAPRKEPIITDIPQAGPEDRGMSLYEKIENTDRTDEIARAARELAAATDGIKARAPAAPQLPLPLEETKSLVMESPRLEREEPKKKKRKASAEKAAKEAKEAKAKRDDPTVPISPIRPPAPAPAPVVTSAPLERRAERVSAFVDEEETLIAMKAPSTIDAQHPRFSESDDRAPTLSGKRAESSPPPPSDLPTERPQAVMVKRSIPKAKEEAPPDTGPVPRRYLGAPGTHGAGAEFHRQMVDRIDRELPEVHAVPLKTLRGELSGDLLHALEDILSGRHDARATDGSISPKRSLEHLINEKSYQALTPKDRGKLLQPIAEDPRDLSTIKSAIAILKTRVLERLPDHVRTKLLDLFSTFDPDARATMAQLAARQLRGKSVLEDRDLRDTSLIDRLNQLVYGDPIPELLETHGVRRERIVKLVLASLAGPAKLSFEEGSPGVISTIEFALADVSPAEYVRLWSEIVSRACAAELVGGGRLELSSRVTADVSFTNQVTPLRIALDQLPELAHPRSKKRESGFVMPGGHGIDADVVSRALTLVYGAGYTVAAGLDTASRHLQRVARDPHRSPPVFVSLLYDRGERLFVFDHIEAGSIFVRAPHGRSTKRAGAYRADPRRAVVNAEQGLESIALEDFEEWVGVALVPRT